MMFIICIILTTTAIAESSVEENDIMDLYEQLQQSNISKTENPFFKLLQPLFDTLEKQKNNNSTGNTTRKPDVLDTEAMVEEIRKYQNQTFKKWNKQMIDFQPDDLLNFDLIQQEILYEEILQPTLMRGAFFTQHFSKDKIRLSIKSPKNQTLYQKDSNEAVFDIFLEEVGEYRFIFTNKNTEKITVTFALDIHDSSWDFLEFKDLDPIDTRVEALHIAIRDQYFYSKLSSQQYNHYQEYLKQADDKLLIYFLIEALGIMCISVWQVFYLKRILSSERII